MTTYVDLGYDNFMNKDLGLPKRKSETEMMMDVVDRAISLNALTIGELTGGTIQTHIGPYEGVKLVGGTGINIYGSSINYYDTAGNEGGTIVGLSPAGLHVYSTGGDVKIESTSNQLRLIYDTMRWDVTPTADAQAAGTHTVTVNMNGTDYKLLLVAA